MRRRRLAAPALAMALAGLALAGCSDAGFGGPVPAAAYGSPDPAVSETQSEAGAVMTCASIASERAAIAQSLQRMGASDGTGELRQRDGELARLAAQKRCGGAAL